MSLLTIVQKAAAQLAIPVPSAVMTSTDTQVVQLLQLAQSLCPDMASRYEWAKLRKIKTFSAVAQTEQTDSVPSDFDYYINESMFDRTTTRKIYGPLTAEDWEIELSFPVYTSVDPAFRFAASSTDPNDYVIWITPNPTAGDTIGYEYASNGWCIASDLTPKSAFTADTDTTIFKEVTVVQGLIAMWKEAKGFDYAEAFQRFEDSYARDTAQDGGKARLNLAVGLGRRTYWPYNIQAGNYPGNS